MGLLSFLSDIPIVGDIVDFGQSLFGGDSGGGGSSFSMPDLSGLFGGLGDTLSSAFGGVRDTLGSAFGGIGDTLKSVLDVIQPYQSTVTGLSSAFSSFLGTQQTNEQRMEMFRQANEFSAQQADVNRSFQAGQVRQQEDFQNFMSNTAYQRAVKDMELAGINPMLAAARGGASTPSGGAASGSAASSVGVPQVDNAVVQAINSGSMAARVSQEIQNMQASRENVQAQTDLTKAQTQKTQMDTAVSQASAGKISSETRNLDQEYQRIEADIREKIARTFAIKEDVQRLRYVNDEILPLVRDYQSIQNKLMVLDLPAARSMARSWETGVGETIRPWLKDIFGAARAAGGVGLRVR